jgi:hypothetical protein
LVAALATCDSLSSFCFTGDAGFRGGDANKTVCGTDKVGSAASFGGSVQALFLPDALRYGLDAAPFFEAHVLTLVGEAFRRPLGLRSHDGDSPWTEDNGICGDTIDF